MRTGLPPAALRGPLTVLERWVMSPRIDAAAKRSRMELALALPGPPLGTARREHALGGVACEELRPRGAREDAALIYLHGGGYVVGSPRSTRGLAGRIARAFGARTVVPDYRLGPEHRHPAALEDARAVFDSLVAEGIAPARIAIAGDSAGAGLALGLAISLRDDGESAPGALGLLCPWLDLRGEALRSRPDAPRSVFASRPLIGWFAGSYADEDAAADPVLSPLLADLGGLPPLVVQSAGDDFLAPDADALEARARAAGTEIEHRRYAGLWHDFQLTSWLLAGQAGDAPAELGRRLAAHIGIGPS